MPVPRLQLLELEDLAWFPRGLRGYAIEYLQFVEHALKLHRVATPLLRDLLARSGSTRLVDLCSGTAGPLVSVVEALRESGVPVEVILTDKYPDLDAFERARRASNGSIGYHADPIDARDVPPHLIGTRTLFNSLHHFAPDDARAVLRGAVSAQQPIAVFELPERRAWLILSSILIPLMVLLATPLVRPFRWGRLVFTYLLPLVPMTCFWDGIVSHLRAYTPQELRALAESVSTQYTWTTGKVPIAGTPARLTYLVGHG